MFMRHVQHMACENSYMAADDTNGPTQAPMRCALAKTLDSNLLKFAEDLIECGAFLLNAAVGGPPAHL
jgi:hypothetical protein